MRTRLTQPTLTPDAAAAIAAGFLADRRARHGDLVMMADDTDDKPGDDGDGDGGAGDDDGKDDDQGADKLGDAGKQALDRMKSQRNEARTQLQEFRALGLTPAQIKALQKPEGGDGKDTDKVDVEAIRSEARTAARTEALHERVFDKIEAKARGFADPEDAVAILMRGRKPDDFLDGDKIDVQEIEEALAELLEKKPHLAAAAQGGRRFGGGADGGARKESRPEQLTQAQLSGMSPAEIVKAKADGRLNDLLGIKSK